MLQKQTVTGKRSNPDKIKYLAKPGFNTDLTASMYAGISFETVENDVKGL
jgi:hypothetical protein